MATAENIGCRLQFPKSEVADMFLASGLLAAMFWAAYGWPLSVALVLGSFGLMFHELSHKIVGRWRCVNNVQFVISPFGVVLGFLTSVVIGHTLAAPGGVTVGSKSTSKDRLIMALGGPMSNMFLFGVFFGMFALGMEWIVTIGGSTINVWWAAALVNLYLSFFNLLPIPMFDGRHIYEANKWVWGSAIGFVGIMMFVFWGDLGQTLIPLFSTNGITTSNILGTFGISVFGGFLFKVKQVVRNGDFIARSALTNKSEEVKVE